MKIEEVLGSKISNVIGDNITNLKAGLKVPSINDFKNEYSEKNHLVFDEAERPNKQIKNSSGAIERLEKVNRIGLAFQKRIVKSTVAFTFGNPVLLNCQPIGDTQTKILAAIKKILADNKVNSLNRKIAKDLARCTQVAEIWYPEQLNESHESYGFSTKVKLKSMILSPLKGDELYPFFNEYGDMIAFSRAYNVKNGNKDIPYFSTYTDEEVIVWKKEGADWNEESKKPHTLGKIPVVFASQEEVEWSEVQTLIDRLEKLLSNFADINDYHAAPILFVEGGIEGFAKKGDASAVMVGEKGSTAEYLSWKNAPDAVKLEIETLIRFIYSFTQTPDISFDSVKGLNQISGITLKMLFLDAHLKVMEKREIFDDYLQRRINILKAYISSLNTTWKAESNKIEIVPEIKPFMVDDLKYMIDNLLNASGNQPLISRKTAMGLLGLVDSVDQEIAQISKEEQQAAALQNFPPAL
ncbi:phage portal protein [Aquirufa aurantiipilula]